MPREDARVALLYAGKYRALVGKPPILKTRSDIVEIYRDGPKKQTRNQVLELMENAKCIYLYENSMISLEARLAGVPVVKLESPLFEKTIGVNETGLKGITNNDSAESISKAREELLNFRQDYLHQEVEMRIQLKKLIPH